MKAIRPAGVRDPVGRYVHGMEVSGGRLLFISGQLPETPDGTVPDGFEAQCRQVWLNVQAVLEGAGLDLSDLVKVTTFLTNRAQAEVNGAVRREVLGSHAPALSVIVAQTLDPAWLLEIGAVAFSAG